MQPASFTPRQAIVHEIPKHRAGELGPGPILSDVVDALDGDLGRYFTEKIRGTLIDKGHRVVTDALATSSVPGVLRGVLDGTTELLEASRDLAQHLYATQSGANSGGLLVVLGGEADGATAVAILKLERQQGVRVVREQLADGRMRFNMGHLRDLMLNERTRVFKAGLFGLTDDRALVDGFVSDEQRGHHKDDVATFFLSRFLGCRLSVDAQGATKAFLMASHGWLNDLSAEPDVKAGYALAVISELKSQERDIDPGDFARRHLQLDDRAGFIQALAANGTPTTVFQKDIKLIEPQLRKLRFGIENGIVLWVPPEHTDQVLFTRDAADDTEITQIRGAVKSFGGR